MTQLRIDNAQKAIEMELMLEGEKEPITVQIPQYTFTADAETPTLTIPAAKVSRAWIEQLVAELLVGKPLPIPPKVANLLRLVL